MALSIAMSLYLNCNCAGPRPSCKHICNMQQVPKLQTQTTCVSDIRATMSVRPPPTLSNGVSIEELESDTLKEFQDNCAFLSGFVKILPYNQVYLYLLNNINSLKIHCRLCQEDIWIMRGRLKILKLGKMTFGYLPSQNVEQHGPRRWSGTS